MTAIARSAATVDQLFASVRNLTEDWDGAGAVRPSAATLSAAEHLIGALLDRGWPAPQRVYAFSTGEVLVEWDDNAVHFELEFAGPDRLTWMRSAPFEPTVHGASWNVDAARQLALALLHGSEVAAGPATVTVEKIVSALVAEKALSVAEAQAALANSETRMQFLSWKLVGDRRSKNDASANGIPPVAGEFPASEMPANQS
jgi:hypothetical protein